MSFLSDLIKIADDITDGLGLQAKVQHYAWTGQDGYGKPTYASPTTISCVVDRTNRMIVGGNGQAISIAATLTKIGDMAPNGASGRREPIDLRDKIVLSDGFTGPVIDSPGAVEDTSTGRGFIQSVMLGAR